MINNIHDYYVDYPNALKLKKLGFNVNCELFFEWYPHYKGNPLSFDDECELKSEGKGKSIRYKELVQRMFNNNEHLKNKNSCSAPFLHTVSDWILENYNIFIDTKPYWCEDGMMWMFETYYLTDTHWVPIKCTTAKKSKQQALADGIEYILDLLITGNHKKYAK